MNTDERLLFANGLYRRGMYELAAPEYRALMTNAAPDVGGMAAFRLGESLRALEQPHDASQAYEAVLRDFPDSTFAARAVFRLGEIDWEAGRLKKAADRFDSLLARTPPADLEAAAQYYLGLCLGGMDRHDEAEDRLKAMLKEHPDSPYADYARLALANTLAVSGGQVKSILKLYDEIVADPETPALGAEAAAGAGLVAYREKDMASAASYFTKLSEAYPESEWIAKTRLEAGWAFCLDGSYDSARERAAAGLAAAAKTERAPWLYLAANIERRAGEADKSQEWYDELLEGYSDHDLAQPAAFESCGLAYKLEDFERVLRLVPLAADDDHERDVLWMKASALEALGRGAEASAAFSALVEQHGESDLAPSAAYRLALQKERSGDLAGAAEDYEAVAKTYPDASISADALMASASAYMKADNVEKAATVWSRLLRNHKDYASRDDAYLGLARAQVKLSRTDSAGKTLKKFMDEFEESRHLAEANYLRGTLFEEEELYEEAEFHYLKALRLKPSAKLQQQVQYRRVAVLQRQGRNGDAADLMNGLLKEGAGDQLPSPLIEWLARWNLENDRDKEAVVAAALLAEIGEAEGWKQIGSYIQGVASLRLNRKKDASEAFKKAAGYGLRTRETADSCFQLGRLALDSNDPDEAIGYFSRAGEYATGDDAIDIRAGSYLMLGRAHEAKENWDDAARYYLSVGVLFDNADLTPEGLYRAAGVLHAQQKNGERDKVVEELRANYPESEWAVRAKERWISE